MKQKLTLILALSLLATSAFSQKSKMMGKSDKKGTLIGLHFNMQDFNAPLGIKDPITGKVYSTFRDMTKGFSVSYWKGLTSRIDFSVKANASFRDYRAIRTGLTQKTEIGLELEPSLNLRPFPDKAMLNPFLTVGIGGGLYTDRLGAYVPAGLGLQVNFNNLTYMFVQGQYRWDITKETAAGDNLFYSIGFAQNISKEKPKVVPPPPPPVVVEAPKDRDNDGVLDVDDKCPDVAGLASLQGCPDRDGDGITDAADKCPDVPGLARYDGCPIPDTDKDGINDEVDKCPTVPGIARYQGCPIPDTDGDGVNDEEDKCINEKGPASNFGCPIISEEIIKKVDVLAKRIYFETGKFKLLAKSNEPLSEIARIMNENPSFNLQIDGHTDDVGKDESNQTLSENRAAAVKAFFVEKGIAESRLASAGYGETKPIEDNKTAKGRALNRRVALRIKNY
jgi:OOP family OmpA-OmpF porin